MGVEIYLGKVAHFRFPALFFPADQLNNFKLTEWSFLTGNSTGLPPRCKIPPETQCTIGEDQRLAGPVEPPGIAYLA